MKTYSSGNLPITSSAVSQTAAHGLGVKPNIFAATFVCVIADAGYAVGQEMSAAEYAAALSGNGSNPSLSVFSDATNIGLVGCTSLASGNLDVILQSSAAAINPTTGAGVGITASHWNIRFDAIAF